MLNSTKSVRGVFPKAFENDSKEHAFKQESQLQFVRALICHKLRELT